MLPGSATVVALVWSARPVSTSVPPLPRQRYAPPVISGLVVPVARMTTSAPVPRDSSLARPAASSVLATACVAPRVRANSRRNSTGSTATTCWAPAIAAPWTALQPTPPVPTTTTTSPCRTGPALTGEPQPVVTLQAIGAATSSGRGGAVCTPGCVLLAEWRGTDTTLRLA